MTQQDRTVRRNDREDAIWRRAWRIALAASVLLHILVVLLFRNEVLLPEVPTAAAGEERGDDAAAAGGGMRSLALNIQIPPPPEPIPRPPAPLPVPSEVEVEIKPQPDPTPAQPTTGSAATGGVGTGQGDRSGAGVGDGRGQGAGGDGDAGTSRVTPPTPRGLILPPSDRPSRVRGKEVVVYVFVTDRGRVLADSTRLAPPTGDSKFDERLRRQASEWVFNPARQDGRAVAEWFKYTIVL